MIIQATEENLHIGTMVRIRSDIVKIHAPTAWVLGRHLGHVGIVVERLKDHKCGSIFCNDRARFDLAVQYQIQIFVIYICGEESLMTHEVLEIIDETA